jgi:xylulokinase
MAGERSPIWDAKAKGVYYGLDFTKTQGHMIRAGLEGAAFALRHNIEVAERAGAKVERLQAMGGAANSRLWTQIKADITGKPIDVPASDTATTLGAALLAGVATGVYRDFDEAVKQTVKTTRSHMPSPASAPVYEKNYQTYLELYQSLKSMMQKGGSV